MSGGRRGDVANTGLRNGASGRHTRRFAVWAAAAAAALAAFAFTLPMLVADADFARGVALAQAGNQSGFDLIAQAGRLAPGEGHYPEVMGDGELLEAESGRFPAAPTLAKAIASYDAAIADNPLESILYLKRGSAEAHGVSMGQPQLAGAAETDMAHALQLAPFRSAYYQQWGQDRLAMGRPADAIPLFEQAIRLGPADASLWASYSQALRAVGRTQEADAAQARYAKERASTP